jgi:hypothetical protein
MLRIKPGLLACQRAALSTKPNPRPRGSSRCCEKCVFVTWVTQRMGHSHIAISWILAVKNSYQEQARTKSQLAATAGARTCILQHVNGTL